MALSGRTRSRSRGSGSANPNAEPNTHKYKSRYESVCACACACRCATAPAQRGCEDGGGGRLGGVAGPKGRGKQTCTTLDARIRPRFASGSIFTSTATSPCTSAANTAGHTKLHRARVERDNRSGAHRFQRDANACEHTHSSCHRMRRPQGRSMQRAACSANATLGARSRRGASTAGT